ncbi:hypothetical protein PPH41_23310 [Burkholderia gladioli]|uniref:hypothetical protein n=1 Tax=Burkholderia gladioli TaxID=28095 RepID=UPI00163E9FFA|nr:hypothetical protein [Burkholderia gladioli]MDC6130799.1 hypothetical protein [Burkholderia gladioli]
MKKVRVFKPARAEQKPSTRWPARPSIQREKWRRFAEDSFARIRTFHAALYSDSQAEGESMNPFDTESLPAPPAREWRPGLIPGSARITDRQVEIMTATLCDAIAFQKLPIDDPQHAIGELIGAMAKQVGRLNEAVVAPVEPEAQVTIDAHGHPSSTSGATSTSAVVDGVPQLGFAITKDWDVIPISGAMAGRRLLAVVLFGDEDFSKVEQIIRARCVAKRDVPALRDCLQGALRKCRESRRSQDERP